MIGVLEDINDPQRLLPCC